MTESRKGTHLAMLLENSLKRNSHFIRFLLVGVLNTIIGLSIMFILLNLFGWSYWQSTFTGNSIGAIISYFLNRSFTFNSRVGASEGIPKFAAVIAFSYAVSYSVSGAAAETLTIPAWAASVVSSDELGILIGTVLYTVTNYLGQKGFVFRRVTE
ncbi:GtrA family protein [Mesobacillus foraminis]|uniref:GtrA family protein n=1 Tax=Mesobacillus foraminis TaxID=279826 RepID=UPI00214BD423|nr:GtrA family protein [Mesobacillus foraminis]